MTVELPSKWQNGIKSHIKVAGTGYLLAYEHEHSVFTWRSLTTALLLSFSWFSSTYSLYAGSLLCGFASRILFFSTHHFQILVPIVRSYCTDFYSWSPSQWLLSASATCVYVPPEYCNLLQLPFESEGFCAFLSAFCRLISS